MTLTNLNAAPVSLPTPQENVVPGALPGATHGHPEQPHLACGAVCHCPAAECGCGLAALLSPTAAGAPVSATRSRLDTVVTHPLLGLVIFLSLMYLVFHLVQDVSAPYMEWIDTVMSGPVTHLAQGALYALAAPMWLHSLVIDGIIAGVGGVLVFLPGLIIMYFALALLEDVGYLPRAAAVMDGLGQRVGLRGRSFLPMILGFGCNTPAIYATRTIESRSTRLLTGLMIPFMSCSARLPIYVVFSLAFFPRHASWVIWGMYLLGIVIAVVMGVVVSRVVLRTPPQRRAAPLPPYQRPSMSRLLRTTFDQAARFVKNAGTVILAVSVVLWVLLHVPSSDPSRSLYGRVSTALAPTLAPAGFGHWQVAGALITGAIAKEMVISSLSQLTATPAAGGTGDGRATDTPAFSPAGDLRTVVAGFGVATLAAGKQLLEVLTPGINLFPQKTQVQDTALSQALTPLFTPLAALAFLVFVLTYIPCISTLAAQANQFGWRWAGVSLGVQTLLPWVMAVLIFQGGRLLGFE